MSYGTATRKVTVELTFEREWDLGGPDTPDSDTAFLDGARVVSGSLPQAFLDALADSADDAWRIVLGAIQ